MKLKIQTRFAIDDRKCQGDYCAVEIYIDGKLVKEWGDSYHDKGIEKAEGYVEGFVDACTLCGAPKPTITRNNIADYEV